MEGVTADADRNSDRRDEFWRSVGQLAGHREERSPFADGDAWPSGRAGFLRVDTPYTGILASDGLSDPTDAAATGLGVEAYLEGRELHGETGGDLGPAEWLVTALEEVAAALAGAGGSLAPALRDHGLLSAEVSGEGAPREWVSGGRLGVLLGVELPGRSTSFDVDGATVRALTVVPLRPSELAVVTSDGPAGRLRVAGALAESGWHSYAESDRPAVL